MSLPSNFGCHSLGTREAPFPTSVSTVCRSLGGIAVNATVWGGKEKHVHATFSPHSFSLTALSRYGNAPRTDQEKKNQKEGQSLLTSSPATSLCQGSVAS